MDESIQKVRWALERAIELRREAATFDDMASFLDVPLFREALVELSSIEARLPPPPAPSPQLELVKPGVVRCSECGRETTKSAHGVERHEYTCSARRRST